MSDTNLTGDNVHSDEHLESDIKSTQNDNLPKETINDFNKGKILENFASIVKDPGEVVKCIKDGIHVVEFISNHSSATGAIMIAIGVITFMWPVWLSLLLIAGGITIIWHSFENK